MRVPDAGEGLRRIRWQLPEILLRIAQIPERLEAERKVVCFVRLRGDLRIEGLHRLCDDRFEVRHGFDLDLGRHMGDFHKV